VIPTELVDILDRTGEVCRSVVDVPPAHRDAVIVAAMRLGTNVTDLAVRILDAQRELDAQQVDDRRPYPKPPPPPPPPPPPGGAR
jgi:hypothetical protein